MILVLWPYNLLNQNTEMLSNNNKCNHNMLMFMILSSIRNYVSNNKFWAFMLFCPKLCGPWHYRHVTETRVVVLYLWRSTTTFSSSPWRYTDRERLVLISLSPAHALVADSMRNNYWCVSRQKPRVNAVVTVADYGTCCTVPIIHLCTYTTISLC